MGGKLECQVWIKSRWLPLKSCAWRSSECFRGQVPNDPHGHPPLHPSRWCQQGRCGCSVQWPYPHQDHQWGLCWAWQKNPPTSPTCSWTRPAWSWTDACYQPSPCSLTLGKAHTSMPTLPLWNPVACAPATLVRGQPYAVVLGPDDRCQQWCGLPVPQAPGHHEGQPEICQASAHSHRLHSVW